MLSPPVLPEDKSLPYKTLFLSSGLVWIASYSFCFGFNLNLGRNTTIQPKVIWIDSVSKIKKKKSLSSTANINIVLVKNIWLSTPRIQIRVSYCLENTLIPTLVCLLGPYILYKVMSPEKPENKPLWNSLQPSRSAILSSNLEKQVSTSTVFFHAICSKHW